MRDEIVERLGHNLLRLDLLRQQRLTFIQRFVKKRLGLAAFLLDLRTERNQPFRIPAHIVQAGDARFRDA